MSTPVRDPASDPQALADAVELLRAGEPVAFPTETVYGLGAPAFDADAVRRVFVLKQRPADNPLIVHVATLEMLNRVVRAVPPAAQALIEAFWPGPLALVLPRQPEVPDIVTAGLDTVAVRMPQHPVAQALLELLDEPLAAPSANRSGRPSPTTAEHVAADFDGLLALVLDGGSTLHGLESTVVDVSGPRPVLLRPGGITLEALEAVAGPVARAAQAAGTRGEAALSPGLRHRHYTPDCRVVLADGAGLADACAAALAAGVRVGLLCHSPAPRLPGLSLVHEVGGTLADYGRQVFAVFREAEREQLDTLVVEAVPEQGLGLAIMDRLRRAAAPAPV
jgi:L-threonylcarbamoyladenylate synthase